MPSNFLFLDTEAHIEYLKNGGQHHTLRLGHAIHYYKNKDAWTEVHRPFKTHGEFYDILDKSAWDHSKCYVVAHNAAYDYGILNMDDYWSSRAYSLSRFVIGQSFMVHGKKDSGALVAFIDSMNWFRSSLRELGKAFGENKFDCPDFDNVSDEDLAAYCKQDVEVLKKAVLSYVEFISKNDLGNFQETFASQALNAYRHRFMPPQSLLIHDYPEVLKMEMASYRGGRTEAFFIGDIPHQVFKLDVNSMYPFVMRDLPYPTRPLAKRPLRDMDLESLQSLDRSKLYLMDANVRLEKPFLGIKKDHKLMFPIGEFEAYLVGPELWYLLDHPEAGEILNINKLVGYDTLPIFASYVDFFFNMKLTTTGPSRVMAKYFLNSLYGKFGQKDVSKIDKLEGKEAEGFLEIFSTIPTNTLTEHGDTTSKVMRLGTSIYRISSPDKNTPSPNAMPIISSMVTAYARVYLWELIEVAGPDHVFYCDTDSLFVDRVGYEALESHGYLHDQRLGALKLEGIGEAEIWGAKLYRFGEDVHMKGIPRGSSYDGTKYDYLEWQTKLRRYDSEPEGIQLVPRSKRLSMVYDKGEVMEDGRVRPWRL